MREMELGMQPQRGELVGDPSAQTAQLKDSDTRRNLPEETIRVCAAHETRCDVLDRESVNFSIPEGDDVLQASRVPYFVSYLPEPQRCIFRSADLSPALADVHKRDGWKGEVVENFEEDVVGESGLKSSWGLRRWQLAGRCYSRRVASSCRPWRSCPMFSRRRGGGFGQAASSHVQPIALFCQQPPRKCCRARLSHSKPYRRSQTPRSCAIWRRLVLGYVATSKCGASVPRRFFAHSPVSDRTCPSPQKALLSGQTVRLPGYLACVVVVSGV